MCLVGTGPLASPATAVVETALDTQPTDARDVDALALPPSPAPRTPTPDDPAGVDGPLALLTLATVGGAVGFLLIVRRHKRRMRPARRRSPRRS